MKEQSILATGRRKEAVAKVWLFPEGRSHFLVNGKEWDRYFLTATRRHLVREPLEKANLWGKVGVKAKVLGGGISGQAGAVRLGLARAIIEYKNELRGVFKKNKLLTRDPRSKERKKYGQKGARRRFQWTKR